jgi:hypothetical protein
MNLSELDRVQLPYRQLTSFTGTSFNTTECLFILAQTLVTCVFYVCHLSRHRGYYVPVLLGGLFCMQTTYLRGAPPPGDGGV